MRKEVQFMPAQYYNPFMNAYPNGYSWSNGSYPTPFTQPVQPPQYMISVDGEASAKSWQPPITPQPNTIIPLFDSDGQHVYFKTFDAYGRMNPVRKGRIVFDDEEPVKQQTVDMSAYATKSGIDKLREELMSKLDALPKRTNQNGTSSRGEK